MERAAVALTLANLQIYCGIINQDTLRYLDIAMECREERITEHASKLRPRVERRLQEM